MSAEPMAVDASSWRLTSSLKLLSLVAFGLLIWAFWDGLYRMWGWWMEEPEYSHGVLIPLVAGFLVWQQKDRLEKLRFEGSWWGVMVLLLGLALLALGELATIYTLIQYAYLFALFGVVLALTGTTAFRVILVPLCVLLFMIPLPPFVLANLSTKLQLLSSQIGVAFIRLFNISVFVEGNVIDLGGYKLQVAEACDGLRYLFPLMTLSFLIAYFYKGAVWKRVLLVLSSIPITVLMNSFRVGTIGVMVEHWGIAMAEGFLHEFQGWLVFMVSAALLLGEVMLLNRIGREASDWRTLLGIELPARSTASTNERARGVPSAFVVCVVMLAAAAAAMQWMPRHREQIPARQAFAAFPTTLGGWSSRRGELERIYLDALKLDDYLLADYTDGAEAPPVNLYMAYYNSQRKGEAVHSPRSCLPGGGWQLREFGQKRIDGVLVDGVPLKVNRTLIELSDQRQLVYYWFQQRGHVITNEFVVKWYLFLDALTRNRTDGALVRLIVPLPPGSDVSVADRRLTQFATQLSSELPRFVPR